MMLYSSRTARADAFVLGYPAHKFKDPKLQQIYQESYYDAYTNNRH